MAEYEASKSRADATPVTGGEDVLVQALQGQDIILDNAQFVIVDHEVVIDAPGNSPVPPAISPAQELGPALCPSVSVPDADAIAVMKSELSAAQATIAKLTGELSRSREKCLKLENLASSDRGQLSNEIATKLDNKMAEGFRTLETSFANKVAKELRSELTRYVS